MKVELMEVVPQDPNAQTGPVFRKCIIDTDDVTFCADMGNGQSFVILKTGIRMILHEDFSFFREQFHTQEA